MTPAPPTLTPSELAALVELVQRFLDAGRAALDPEIVGQKPSERWAAFRPAEIVGRTPHRVQHLLARHGWHQDVTSANTVVAEISALLTQAGRPLDDVRLRGALAAAGYWLDPMAHSALADEKAMIALEDLNGFVHGYLQSLPLRLTPGEHVDSANRRFRAYQRRRSGPATAVRSPQLMTRRLPMAARELLDGYADLLLFGSPVACRALAATLAVALGRPVDRTIAAQLDITLAVAVVWRELNDLPIGADAHPLLGVRPEFDPERWQTAYDTVNRNLAELREGDDRDSAPTLVQTSARVPVAGVALDARALDALQRLDDFVATFAAWLRRPQSAEMALAQRLPAFDRAYRGGSKGAQSGADIVAALPPAALRVVAAHDALTSRGRPGDEVVDALATALGDSNFASRHRRTLVTTASWLHGTQSELERSAGRPTDRSEEEPARADRPETRSTRRPKPQPVPVATGDHDVEGLLDLGTSVVELVRFSRTLDPATGDRPKAWWLRFHRGELGPAVPTPALLLARLPADARKLLAHHGTELASRDALEPWDAGRRLMAGLDRPAEELCVGTLAVALSVGVIWGLLEKNERDDTLLGAEPVGGRQRYLWGRAQTHLEWGLQELLGAETSVGA